jgi:hypothetical protein
VLEVSMLLQRATRGEAHVSGLQRGAEPDDSKGFGAFRSPLPSVLALRAGPAVAGAVDALGVLIATVTAVIRITIGTTIRVARVRQRMTPTGNADGRPMGGRREGSGVRSGYQR